MRNQVIQADDGDPEMIEATIMVKPSERQGGMRLNNAMKLQVLDKALAHAFNKRTAALLKEEHILARLFWLNKFGPAKLKAALFLGEPFAVVCKDRYNNPAPDGLATTWNVGGHHVGLRTLLPIPMHGTLDSVRCVIKDEALVARCREWQDNKAALEKERERVRSTLSGMLGNIASYTTLEKNWPQGKPFYKHLPTAFPYRHQVPAVLIDQLNADLGIG